MRSESDRSEDQGSRSIEDSASLIVWCGHGATFEIQCAAGVLAEIAEIAVSGYSRYPWGGVEIGGVVFGTREAGAVQIHSFREAECEHHYGPAFHLSKKDYDAFEDLLAAAATDEKLARLTPVGWYQSVSRHDGGLSEHARALFQRFFPEPWQIAIVVRRSKQDPISVGVFVHDSHGGVELHSPVQEFARDALRQLQTPPAAPEPPVIEPELVSRAAEQPLNDGAQLVPEAPASESAPDTPLAFFGLTADPFCAPPDALFFYPSPQHREALAILFYRIRSRAGFLALLGAPGTGKSIVLECLVDLLRAHETQFAYLLNSRINAAEFFELIAHDFHLPCARTTKTTVLIALNQYLLGRSLAGQTTALVVDNAQKLSTEVLEEIELLGNLENRDGQLLQVVFAAQPGFERQVDAPELRGLKQRLMRARLEPLDAVQTAFYIEHRMAKAGASRQDVFPADVVAEVHRRTQGVPRLINILCSTVLASCHELHVKTALLNVLDRAENRLAVDTLDESRGLNGT